MQTTKGVSVALLKSIKEATEENSSESRDGITIDTVQEVNIGGELPPKDKVQVLEGSEPEEGPQLVEEKKKEEVVEESSQVGPEVHFEEPKVNTEDDVVILDDLVRTLTEGGLVRRPTAKPNERVVDALLEEEEDSIAANAASSVTSEREQEQPVKTPTVVSVVGGLVVFLGQSAGSALSYLTPNFVRSFCGNVTAFFGNIKDLFSRISTKK